MLLYKSLGNSHVILNSCNTIMLMRENSIQFDIWYEVVFIYYLHICSILKNNNWVRQNLTS